MEYWNSNFEHAGDIPICRRTSLTVFFYDGSKMQFQNPIFSLIYVSLRHGSILYPNLQNANLIIHFPPLYPISSVRILPKIT